MSAAPKDVESYLAALPPEPRAALEKLRKTVHGAAPGAVEVIAYQMPAFRLGGPLLVSFAAFKDHCSLFPMSLAVIAAHQEDLKPFNVSKGTVRFTPDKPLPASLVKKIVWARIAENELKRDQLKERKEAGRRGRA